MLRHARRCHAPELASLARPPLLEEASTSTRENAERSLYLVRQHAPSTRDVFVVTNRFHQRRACATFRRVAANCSSTEAAQAQQRLRVWCVAMPPSLDADPPAASPAAGDPHEEEASCGHRSADALEMSFVLVRETLALVKYWAVGWL